MVLIASDTTSSVEMGKQIEANTVPNASYKEAFKISVASDGVYVTGLSLNRERANLVAVTSNMEIKCYSIEKQECIQTFSGGEMPISGIRHSHESPDLLYTSCLDGNISLWDLRAKNSPVQKYFDVTDGELKPITAFDICLNETHICGGTELLREDAFLIFWDKRTAKNLGGYWDGHTDDITQVKFHPFKNSAMATGSTDGLINVYDLNQNTEEDALTYTLNTASSVANISWHCNGNQELNQSHLSCVTHIEEMQFWGVDDASPRISSDRIALQDIGKVQVDYLIDTVSDDNGSTYLISGKRPGAVHVWMVNGYNVTLWCSLDTCHKGDVRAVTWSPADKMMYTGAEDGLVCIWKLGESDTPTSNFKMQSHMKELTLKHQQKPY